MAGELKAAAAAKGVRLGVGIVENSGLYWWGGQPIAWPETLNYPTDPGAALVVDEFGGAIDLGICATGYIDAGPDRYAIRWTAPGVYNFAGADEAYAFAVAHGMHVYIQDPLYGTIPPPWVPAGGYTPAQITQLAHDWYEAVYTRYPLAYAATLLNEFVPDAPFTPTGTVYYGSGDGLPWFYRNSSVGLAGGKSVAEFAVTVSQWVQGFNPNIKIVLNQARAETGQQAANVLSWAVGIRSMGGPIRGVGMQCHFFDPRTPSQALLNDLTSRVANIAAAGLEPHITEFDITNYWEEWNGDTWVWEGPNNAQWATSHLHYAKALLAAGVVHDFNVWGPCDPHYLGFDSQLHTAPPEMARKAAFNYLVQAFNEAPVQRWPVPGPLPDATIPVGGAASWSVTANGSALRIRGSASSSVSRTLRFLVDGVEVATAPIAGDGLYPTAAGGREWYLPDDVADLAAHPEVYAESSSLGSITLIQGGPSSIYQTAGLGASQATRINIMSPEGQAWWRNVEMTAYYRWLTEDGLSWPHWEFEARGERHTTNSSFFPQKRYVGAKYGTGFGNTNLGPSVPPGTATWPWFDALAPTDAITGTALGTAYHGNLYARHGTNGDDDWALFEKELAHLAASAGYGPQRGKVDGPGSGGIYPKLVPAANTWFGAKFICRTNVAGTQVKLELWVDLANDGSWQKVSEVIDEPGTANNWACPQTDYGMATNQLITWASPWVCFRADHMTFQFKKLSVREVAPY